MTRRKQCSGFTLFEILIATFIFAIIITTIFGSFRVVFSNVDAIPDGIYTYQMTQTCMSRMMEDLHSIRISQFPGYRTPEFNDPPDPYRLVGDSSFGGSGSFSRLRFTSSSHISLNNSTEEGIAEIVYYVMQTRNEEFVLKRSDSLFLDKQFEEKSTDPTLCKGIKSLVFTYYNEENEEVDQWDSDSDDVKYATPRKVKIKLEFEQNAMTHGYEVTVALPIYRDKIE